MFSLCYSPAAECALTIAAKGSRLQKKAEGIAGSPSHFGYRCSQVTIGREFNAEGIGAVPGRDPRGLSWPIFPLSLRIPAAVTPTSGPPTSGTAVRTDRMAFMATGADRSLGLEGELPSGSSGPWDGRPRAAHPGANGRRPGH
jgi:hypothetical protein